MITEKKMLSKKFRIYLQLIMKWRKEDQLKNISMSRWFTVIAGVISILFPISSVSGQKSHFDFKGLKRTFKVYIPESFDKSLNLPLIIALHGKGGKGRSMILLTRRGFNKLAEKDGFIMVYPDGIEKNWNDGRMDEESNDRAHRENIDDVGFISALIDFMINNYNADSRRVYVTGISNGAIMSYRLACEISHKITAIAPVDGNIPRMLYHECLPSVPVSVLAINNMNDPLVPYDGGEIYGHFHRVKLGEVLSVDESVGFWAKQNGCSTTPVLIEEPDSDPKDGTRVNCKQYLNGNDGTEVILYSVDGGGHTWPGGIQYLPEWMIGKTSRDINATEVIWAFFKRHSRD
jgi:polyhydroxybutyrate depolymerase